MSALLTNTALRFSLTFKVPTLKVRFTDLLSSLYASTYGLTVANVRGIINVTGSVSGVVYQNAGWSAGTYGTPDITGAGTPVWYKEFDLPVDVDGKPIQEEYTVEYKFYNGSATLTAPEKSYTYNYTSPVVIPVMSHVCRTALLTAEDNTITDYLFGSIVPTIARRGTITEPTGTTRTPAGYDDSTDLTWTWTIGGTSDPTTSLWSGTWQLNISTVLSYDVETWDTYTWVTIEDTVTGYISHAVQCTDCACILNQCIANFFDYALGKRDNNPAKYAELEPKVIEVLMRWQQFTSAERCGEEYDTFCQDIKDIVKGVDCFCAQDSTTTPATIYPIASSTVTTGGGTFLFSLISSLPGGTPSWDWAILWDGLTVSSASTYYKLYQNTGGVATYVGDLKGAAGAAGTDGSSGVGANLSILWNDIGNSGTPAGTSETTLKTYTLPSGIMENNGEQIEIESICHLAANDNTKTVKMYFGGDTIFTYVTDSLIVAGDDRLRIGATVSRTAAAAQYITAKSERANQIYSPKETVTTKDLTGPVIIHLSGQNGTASANDIIAKQFCIKYSGLVNSTPVISADLKFGTATLLAGVTKTITFATYGWTNFASTPYTLNLTAVDVDGNTQQVTIIGTPAIDEFEVSTVVDTTLNWSAFL